MLQFGQTPATPGALSSYDDALKQSFVWKDLYEVRNMRPAFGRGFLLGGALAGAMTASKGRFPPRDLQLERDAVENLQDFTLLAAIGCRDQDRSAHCAATAEADEG